MPLNVGPFRRQRLWTPRDLGPALCLWLDASDLNTITLNGGNVSQWSDKSGLGNHVRQATGSAQPAFSPGSLTFTSANSQFLGSSASPALPTGNSSRTLIYVASPNQPVTYTVPVAWGTFGTPNQIFQCTLRTTNSGLYIGGGTSPNETHTATGTFGIQAVLYDADSATNNLTCRFNGGVGSNSVTQTLATIATGSLYIGQASNSGYFSGSISDVCVVSGPMTYDKYTRLEGYYAWQRGLQSYLSTLHPYKLQPPRVTL